MMYDSTAASVLAAVKSGISKYGAKKVTLTGHSLGMCLQSRGLLRSIRVWSTH